LVIIAGCVAQAENQEMLKREPYIDLVIGPQAYHKINDTILNYTEKNKKIEETEFDAVSKFKYLSKIKNEAGKVSSFLTIQEGGRVLNLCDNINKVKSMNRVIKILKKTEDKIKTIAVGDNYNDLDMLKSCDIPCLVFNDQFIQDQINIDNLIFSNKPSPEGWADVIKTALLKLGY